MPPHTSASLVTDASAGDQRAWALLHQRYDRVLSAVARSYRLSDADVQEATQTAWLRLVERIETIRDPEAVGGWLVTTTRRECLHILARRKRETPQDPGELEIPSDSPGPEAIALRRELEQAVWNAVRRLPERPRKLIVLQTSGAPRDYVDITRALQMPIGSIGPTRGRALSRLARDPRLAEIVAA